MVVSVFDGIIGQYHFHSTVMSIVNRLRNYVDIGSAMYLRPSCLVNLAILDF